MYSPPFSIRSLDVRLCVIGTDTSQLNHGITLSRDGKTLYASSAQSVYQYAYDPSTASNTTAGKEIVTNMTTEDHTTRTLLLSNFSPNTLIVTRGSTSNLDAGAEDISTGRSQIKAFDISTFASPSGSSAPALDFSSASGKLLGWGMRNDVGIDEHPVTGGLYSVENSVDQMTRLGTDIHQNNPGEEMNYLGTLLNNSYSGQGGNYGYPDCYAAWNVTEIPDNAGLETGTQFAIGAANSTINDTTCQHARVAPRLTFQAHMAPLAILFSADGGAAWVSYHGSWDRAPPVGYKIGTIAFDAATGQPTAPRNSSSALADVVANPDLAACPAGCFRPVALAWDAAGRLWFSSDASGEIYVVTRSGGLNVTSPAASATASNALPTASAAASSGGANAGGAGSVSSSAMAARMYARVEIGGWVEWAVGVAGVVAVLV